MYVYCHVRLSFTVACVLINPFLLFLGNKVSSTAAFFGHISTSQQFALSILNKVARNKQQETKIATEACSQLPFPDRTGMYLFKNIAK